MWKWRPQLTVLHSDTTHAIWLCNPPIFLLRCFNVYNVSNVYTVPPSQELNVLRPKAGFRLWLTAEIHPRFPPILLQSSLKITYEVVTYTNTHNTCRYCIKNKSTIILLLRLTVNLHVDLATIVYTQFAGILCTNAYTVHLYYFFNIYHPAVKVFLLFPQIKTVRLWDLYIIWLFVSILCLMPIHIMQIRILYLRCVLVMCAVLLSVFLMGVMLERLPASATTRLSLSVCLSFLLYNISCDNQGTILYYFSISGQVDVNCKINILHRNWYTCFCQCDCIRI